MRERQFIVVLLLAAVVGVIASFAAWCFLEAVHLAEAGVYQDLPDALGFEQVPLWWPLPILFIAGAITALAISRLPGTGGHVPSEGLNASPTLPAELPGVVLAGLAGVALGAVVGPEAPLIAIGGGLGYFVIGRLRADAPPELSTLVAACGTFAAVSFLFGSPVIAAVLLIEATGVGGRRQSLLLIPGLLAAGIGTLVSVGLGAWTGVDTSDIAISVLPLSEFARPDAVDFLWTIPFAAAIAVATVAIFRLAGKMHGVVASRLTLIPIAGLAVGGLAIAFAETTDKNMNEVLFSGESALDSLVANAESWSLGALALLIVFKGLAYAISLASFRGGPVFPAMFLGSAAGLMAAELPGLELSPAVAVGLAAAVVAVLRLPLTAVVLATLLCSSAGLGVGPLVIVGVVVAYLIAQRIDPRPVPEPA